MSQLTLRVSEELAADIKAKARDEGKSVNAWATFVLRSATDPTYGGEEGDRLRERLERAGLLVPRSELQKYAPVRRPSPEEVAAAGAAAAHGTLLSDLVSEGRG